MPVSVYALHLLRTLVKIGVRSLAQDCPIIRVITILTSFPSDHQQISYADLVSSTLRISPEFGGVAPVSGLALILLSTWPIL